MSTRITSIALVLWLFGCAGGQVSPRAQRAVETFECLVAVVTPHVGDALDAAELVRDTVKGRANLSQALRMLGASAADLRAVNDGMKACLPPLAPAPLQPEPDEYAQLRAIVGGAS